MFWIVGVLLIVNGGDPTLSQEDCDFDAFSGCMREVAALQTGDFDIVSEENLKEVCNSKRQAIRCASGFIQNCMKKGERELYEATTGGRLRVVEDMCSPGTRINKGFLENMGCFAKIQDEVRFCNDKFKQSQDALNKASMLDRLKVFYGCCAFEWHRNCLAKAARMRCDDLAADFVYHVSTMLGGQVQNQICSTSYANCHGLHGVEDDEEDMMTPSDSEEESDSGTARKLFPDATVRTLILFSLLFAFLLIF